MSLDAWRHVLALREAGLIPGGARFAVLLVLADGARHTDGGRVRLPMRSLARLVDVDLDTVSRALRAGVEGGAVEVVERGRGRTPSTYRLPPGPVDNGNVARGSSVQSESVARGSVRGSSAQNGAVARGNSAVSARIIPTSLTRPGNKPGPPAPRAPVDTPTDAALALVVEVEQRVELLGGRVDRPDALAATIRRRIASQYGARLQGLIDEGVEPNEAAAAILAEDRVGGACPFEGCNARDARPIIDASRCSRRERCAFYVGFVEVAS